MRRSVAALALFAACAVPRETTLARDEIAADELSLPEGARAGMWVTWRHAWSDPDPDDEVEETLACVARDRDGVTIERRATYHDGRSEVTAARFQTDGTPIGAWRGAPGGAGRPLTIVSRETDPEEARRRADEAGRAIGVSTSDVRVDEERDRQVVETPAGPIRCHRQRWKVSLLFVSMTMAVWHAERPLPLTSLVRLVDDAPGHKHEMIVVGYGTTGAAPELRIE